jgi:threonine synthase
LAVDQQTSSLATSQRSVLEPSTAYPLWPPLTEGDPVHSTAQMQYPLEVAFDLAAGSAIGAFTAGHAGRMSDWQPLLPPLAAGIDLGAGNTPLIDGSPVAARLGLDTELYLKDESQNPTWSHKDRLNTCTVSAAVLCAAAGVVVASSGNHGASAAAISARAGLRCIVLAPAGAPPAIYDFLRAYGASVIAVPAAARWVLTRQIVSRLGFHPVSNLTPSAHTGHPFGPEGYKTIAYECFLQLGRRVPGAVLVPCGYGELLFGVWKGFTELKELGLARSVPRMFAAEPAARAPLHHALAAGLDAARVAATATAAASIGTTVGGYRGVRAVQGSGGAAIAVSEQAMRQAQAALGRSGLWQELSGAAGLGALVALGNDQPGGPVVCILTSSGFKDRGLPGRPPDELPGTWAGVADRLRADGIL